VFYSALFTGMFYLPSLEHPEPKSRINNTNEFDPSDSFSTQQNNRMTIAKKDLEKFPSTGSDIHRVTTPKHKGHHKRRSWWRQR
jgi:hypothetical protein